MFECMNCCVRIKIVDFVQYSWTTDMMDYLEMKSGSYNEKKNVPGFLRGELISDSFLKTLQRLLEEYLMFFSLGLYCTYDSRYFKPFY